MKAAAAADSVDVQSNASSHELKVAAAGDSIDLQSYASWRELKGVS